MDLGRVGMYSQVQWRQNIQLTFHKLPTFGLSLTVWIFGSITGISAYKISITTGIQRSFQCIFICSAILQVSLSTVKISVLLFYKRTFSIPKSQIAACVAIAIVGCWGIAFFFVSGSYSQHTSHAQTNRHNVVDSVRRRSYQ